MEKDGDEVAEEEGESAEQSQEKPEATVEAGEETENKEEDVEELKKVIKVDDKKEEKKKEPSPQEETIDDADLDTDMREGVEQKRAILQSIKDFDFQIKKNQEEITSINNKLDAVSRDLDDLVSLYEIVSEQMNPFVGLSKVTKKRLDALETFTKEIDDLKNRMGDVESFAVRAGADLKNISELREKEAQKSESIKEEISDGEKFVPKTDITDSESGETSESEISSEDENIETGEDIKVDKKILQEIESGETIDTRLSTNFTIPDVPRTSFSTYSDNDIELILDRALSTFTLDYKIDRFLDEFIESLKT